VTFGTKPSAGRLRSRIKLHADCHEDSGIAWAGEATKPCTVGPCLQLLPMHDGRPSRAQKVGGAPVSWVAGSLNKRCRRLPTRRNVEQEPACGMRPCRRV
jgi:hypothetical protein